MLKGNQNMKENFIKMVNGMEKGMMKMVILYMN